MGANAALGHKLWHRDFPKVEQVHKAGVVIIGSGISGLAAARTLYKSGIQDLRILELESLVGGNSCYGQNNISRYPWGAHYLTLPTQDCSFLYDFLQECQVITGFDARGKPIYNEEFLCHDLKERLFINGKFQEGLIPKHAISEEDQQEIDTFFRMMESFKYATGCDGKKAFCIPVDLSSQDHKYLILDQTTMAEYMNHQGWVSKYLYWYVDYCCRDDYGAGIDKVSAWAGIHYFASRRSEAANSESDAILTWPEGNGWLVDKLSAPYASQIESNSLVYQVELHEDKVIIDYFDAINQTSKRLICEAAIMAVPHFVSAKIFNRSLSSINNMEYSPWFVANISLSKLPPSRGVQVAWDNVSYYSRSLGYVHASHQNFNVFEKETVITYYLPLDELPPKEARREALERRNETWKKYVLEDLDKIHPGLSAYVQRIDMWIWGHGMVRPIPGFLWGKMRKDMPKQEGRLAFSHSDMSGLSLFEEAYWQGLNAANRILAVLKR